MGLARLFPFLHYPSSSPASRRRLRTPSMDPRPALGFQLGGIRSERQQPARTTSGPPASQSTAKASVRKSPRSLEFRCHNEKRGEWWRVSRDRGTVSDCGVADFPLEEGQHVEG